MKNTNYIENPIIRPHFKSDDFYFATASFENGWTDMAKAFHIRGRRPRIGTELKICEIVRRALPYQGRSLGHLLRP